MNWRHMKGLRLLWQPPRPHSDVVEDRTVSFLELFYDLVYVVLIAAVAHNLAGHMDWASVGEFTIVFSLVWFAWLNGTTQYDLHGREDIRTRTFTFVQMLLIALLAVYASEGEDGRDEFAIVYSIFLVVLAWLWLAAHRRSDEGYKRTSRYYLSLLFLVVVAMISSVFIPPSAQLWIWGATVIVWICAGIFVTQWGAARAEVSSVVSHSFVERFGLFTIIVLGEVVVGVVDGVSGSARNVETIATGMMALMVGFGLWWNYFDLAGRRLPMGERSGLHIWIVLHLPLTMAIAAAGAAMVGIIEHADAPRSPQVAAWVLTGSVAVALVSIALLVRTLVDWARYRQIYLVTSILMVILATGTVPLGVWRPDPITLVSMLLGLLTVSWCVAVFRWLRTEAGEES